MRLLFLSSMRGNNDRKLKSLVGDWYKKGKIGYIPSSPDPLGVSFQQTKDFFKKLDPKGELKYLDIFGRYSMWSKDMLKEFSGFIVGGGDSYSLLFGLKKSGMDKCLADIAKVTEKPIIGIDEGGIALTPEVGFSKVKNLFGLKDTHGLNLVNFEFYPHFKEKLNKKFQKYLSKMNLHEAYGVSDDSGVAVEGSLITSFGKVSHILL